MDIHITKADLHLISQALTAHAATLMQISYQLKVFGTKRGSDLQKTAAECLHLAAIMEHADNIEVQP